MELIIGLLFAKKMATGRGFSFTKILRNTQKQNKSITKAFKELIKMVCRFERFIDKGSKAVMKSHVSQATVVVENKGVVNKNVIDFENFKLKKVNSK